MKSYFKIMNIDDAIKKLQDVKKNNGNGLIIIYTIDFDNNTESRKATTVEYGSRLVKKSKTIIMNEDQYIPHMELYSIKQTDIKNIIKKGVMHDIILPTYTQ